MNKFIAENSLSDLMVAIRNKRENKIEEVTVNVSDLAILQDMIEDSEMELEGREIRILMLEGKLRTTLISLAKSELKALDKPMSLDVLI